MEAKLLPILNFNGPSSNTELALCKVLHRTDFIVKPMYVYYQSIIVKRNNKTAINYLHNNTLFYNINFGLHKL